MLSKQQKNELTLAALEATYRQDDEYTFKKLSDKELEALQIAARQINAQMVKNGFDGLVKLRKSKKQFRPAKILPPYVCMWALLAVSGTMLKSSPEVSYVLASATSIALLAKTIKDLHSMSKIDKGYNDLYYRLREWEALIDSPTYIREFLNLNNLEFDLEDEFAGISHAQMQDAMKNGIIFPGEWREYHYPERIKHEKNVILGKKDNYNREDMEGYDGIII